jgi:hypothetical protein
VAIAPATGARSASPTPVAGKTSLLTPSAAAPTPAPSPILPDLTGSIPGQAAGAALRVPDLVLSPGSTPPSARVACRRTPAHSAAIVRVRGAVPVPSRVRPGSALSGTSRRPLATSW